MKAVIFMFLILSPLLAYADAGWGYDSPADAHQPDGGQNEISRVDEVHEFLLILYEELESQPLASRDSLGERTFDIGIGAPVVWSAILSTIRFNYLAGFTAREHNELIARLVIDYVEKPYIRPLITELFLNFETETQRQFQSQTDYFIGAAISFAVFAGAAWNINYSRKLISRRVPGMRGVLRGLQQARTSLINRPRRQQLAIRAFGSASAGLGGTVLMDLAFGSPMQMYQSIFEIDHKIIPMESLWATQSIMVCTYQSGIRSALDTVSSEPSDEDISFFDEKLRQWIRDLYYLRDYDEAYSHHLRYRRPNAESTVNSSRLLEQGQLAEPASATDTEQTIITELRQVFGQLSDECLNVTLPVVMQDLQHLVNEMSDLTGAIYTPEQSQQNEFERWVDGNQGVEEISD